MMDGGDGADSAKSGATNERTKVDVGGEQMKDGATRWQQYDAIVPASAFHPRFVGIDSNCIFAMHWDWGTKYRMMKR